MRHAALSGAAGVLGPISDALAADPPPETTRLRIAEIPSTCRSPEWIAADLLRAEGFTDVQYNRVAGTLGVEKALASGEADISGHFAAPVIVRLEAGDPIVVLGGEHVGCFELLANDRIRSIRDLIRRSEKDMLGTKNFGKKSLTEIKDLLHGMGLDFGMEFDEQGNPIPGSGGRDLD